MRTLIGLPLLHRLPQGSIQQAKLQLCNSV